MTEPLPLVIPAYDLYGTRSSGNWRTHPGRMDMLNTWIVWPSSGRYGLPPLDPCDADPTLLAPYDRRRECRNAATCGGAIHFFRDDYRFESIWAKPDRTLERLTEVGITLTPDFSCWLEMPVAAQIWQTYRSRWLGAFWQYHGLTVIPTLTWGYPESYEWVFEGLTPGATVAVSATGMNRRLTRQTFVHGFAEMLRRLCPNRVLVYGKLPPECRVMDLPAVHEYPTISDQIRDKLSERTPKWDEDKQPEVESVAVEAQEELPLVLAPPGSAIRCHSGPPEVGSPPEPSNRSTLAAHGAW